LVKQKKESKMKSIGAMLGIFFYASTIYGAWGTESQIVYDNTEHTDGAYLQDVLPVIPPYQGTKVGELIGIEGTARYITKFETILRGNSAGEEDFPAEVRLVLRRIRLRPWEPGVPIWQSNWKTINLLHAVDQIESFEVPNVRVPKVFVWTLEFRGFEPYLEAPTIPFYDPPVVGKSANNYFYFNVLAQEWFFQDIAGKSFYAKIWANTYDDPNGNNNIDLDQSEIKP
jgi:hypothetical protein